MHYRLLHPNDNQLPEWYEWQKIIDAWPTFHDHQVDHDTPPFLLFTSDIDLSLIKHAEDFQQMLKNAGVFVAIEHVPNTTHFSIFKNWHQSNNVGHTILSFVKELLI